MVEPLFGHVCFAYTASLHASCTGYMIVSHSEASSVVTYFQAKLPTPTPKKKKNTHTHKAKMDRTRNDTLLRYNDGTILPCKSNVSLVFLLFILFDILLTMQITNVKRSEAPRAYF